MQFHSERHSFTLDFNSAEVSTCVLYTLTPLLCLISLSCVNAQMYTRFSWQSRWALIDPARQKSIYVSHCRILGMEYFRKSQSSSSLISFFLILFKYLKIKSASCFLVEILFNWFQTHLPLRLNQLFNAIVKSVHFICS